MILLTFAFFATQWTPIEPRISNAIEATVSPANGSIVLLQPEYSNSTDSGFRRSLDGGLTYSQVTVPGLTQVPDDFQYSASGDLWVLARAASAFAVSLNWSPDDGASFVDRSPGLTFGPFDSPAYLATAASDPDHIWVGTRGSFPDSTDFKLSKSTDKGLNWSQVNLQGVPPSTQTLFLLGMAVSPDDPNRVVVRPSGATDRFFVTTDGGSNWSIRDLPFTVNSYAFSGSNLIAATRTGLFRSTNFGVSWSLVGASGHRVAQVAVDPSDSASVWALAYEVNGSTRINKVSRSINGGATFEFLNGALFDGYSGRLTVDDSGRALVASEHLGMVRIDPGVPAASQVYSAPSTVPVQGSHRVRNLISADGDPTRLASIVYYEPSAWERFACFSTDGGDSWDLDLTLGGWVSSLACDADGNWLVGAGGVNDGSSMNSAAALRRGVPGSWTSIGPVHPESELFETTSIATDPNDASVIYITQYVPATDLTRVMGTADSGATWTMLREFFCGGARETHLAADFTGSTDIVVVSRACSITLGGIPYTRSTLERTEIPGGSFQVVQSVPFGPNRSHGVQLLDSLTSSPASPGKFAASWGFEVLLSGAGGLGWTAQALPDTRDVRLSPYHPGRVYGLDQYAVSKAESGQAHWSPLAWPDPTSYQGDTSFWVSSREGTFFLFGAAGAWKRSISNPVGEGFCEPAAPNSQGTPSLLTATGSPFIVDDGLSMHAESLPSNVFGMIVAARATAPPVLLAGGPGLFCLGGPFYRMQSTVQSSSSVGTIDAAIPMGSLAGFGGPASVSNGETWTFQLWHRDTTAGGSPATNLSPGVSVLLR